MTSFGTVAAVLIIFAALLSFETEDLGARLRARQTSLFAWLVSGNWPAKLGATLLILGVGALLRYSLAHVNVAPEAKLAAGVLTTALLAALSYRLRNHSAQRAVHLALAGTAGGVAYLTAYAAFAMFGYISNEAGLILLTLVSAGVGVFAVQANVMSVAVLSMVGAFTAPAFALTDPGPATTLGYYLGASLLVCAIVYRRSWRPLIHLSFLFTLAGGLFFGWTAKYFQPEHYAVVQPLLVALIGLHALMPLIEQRAVRGPWQIRIDTGFALALPVIAALLTYAISPSLRPHCALGLTYLGIVWLALCALAHRSPDLRVLYGLTAAFFLALAIVVATSGASIYLVLILLGTAVLTAGERVKALQAMDTTIGFAMVILGNLEILRAAFEGSSGIPFLNTWFAKLAVCAALLTWSAMLCKRRGSGIATGLKLVAAAMMVTAVVVDGRRMHIVHLMEILHLLCLVSAIALLRFGDEAIARKIGGWVLAASVITAWFTHWDSPPMFAAMMLIADVAGLLLAALIAGRRLRLEGLALSALILAPVAVAPWAVRALPMLASSAQVNAVEGTMMMLAVLGSILTGRCLQWSDKSRIDGVLALAFFVIAACLATPVTVAIERGGWNVAFELSALCCLGAIAWVNRAHRSAHTYQFITLLMLLLVMQAMLLRLLGPSGRMTLLDAARMDYPAVLSLMWACCGSALVWWSSRVGSHGWWTSGSMVMALSAAKLLLIDIGSLGELSNILALIAAGVVFLLIAWLVPVPPKPGNTTSTATTSDALA